MYVFEAEWKLPLLSEWGHMNKLVGTSDVDGH